MFQFEKNIRLKFVYPTASGILRGVFVTTTGKIVFHALLTGSGPFTEMTLH